MEPGHEDREYRGGCPQGGQPVDASMEPGHEDREYLPAGRIEPIRLSLNGARS